VSVAFYFDHNVRAAIVHGLRQRGVDVLVSLEDGYSEADDPDVLARATDLGRVVFTNDDDFLVVAHEWLKNGRTFAGVIYVHQLRLTVGQTIADLDVIATAGTPEDFVNRIEFLPL
jgi:predicted nuclease of predicted toxin-antitoxin system